MMFNLEDNSQFYIIAILLGIAYGFVAQRRQFCFSGSIKDIILYSHTKRLTSVIMAVLSAIVLSQVVAYFYEIDLSSTRYYAHINYLFIVIGGALFGFGMMIADGCCSRHIVRLAQGDRDSLLIILTMGLFSYFTYTLLALYGDFVHSIAFVKFGDVTKSLSLPLSLMIPILITLLFLSSKKCTNILQCWDGILIGAIISLAWYATFYFAEELFLDVSIQSLSFVYPLGKMIDYAWNGIGSEGTILLFSVLSALGVFLGAFVSAQFNRRYKKKLNCAANQNPPKLPLKLFGAALMGFGGILAVGCTVGQGLSGISSLSFASILAITSIYTAAYFTAKWLHKRNALIACFLFDFNKK